MCLQKVSLIMLAEINLENHLQNYFGLSHFREGQKEIITDVLTGKDVLGVLPTGSGKSLCYQLPARLLDGHTIVVSPLISLMIDQVKQLKANGFKRVVALNSFMSYEKRQHVYNHLANYQLIYVSPEILQQDYLLNRLKRLKVSLFVIDEAHCISQWGHEFRPDYLRLQNVIQQFNNPPILALSATVTPQVKHDILTSLNRPHMVKHIYPMDRKNIVLNIERTIDDLEKNNYLYELLKERYIPTLIYFSSRKATEQVAHFLQNKLPSHRISYYHGGMEAIDRLHIQQQFMNDQLDIICCTSAFGMGINKQDIRLVVHYHIPSQIESFIQEIGRAGRDGKESISIVLYHMNDLSLPKRLIENELPTNHQIVYIFNQLKNIYNNNKSLPMTEEQIVNTFNCDITQWRFLFYQFEKSGMINDNRIMYNYVHWEQSLQNIIKVKNDRLQYKYKQLDEMIEWLQADECLRKALYQKFQSSYTKLTKQCCQLCGFSIKAWQTSDRQLQQQDEHNWKQRLKNMFFIKGSYESKKIN